MALLEDQHAISDVQLSFAEKETMGLHLERVALQEEMEAERDRIEQEYRVFKCKLEEVHEEKEQAVIVEQDKLANLMEEHERNINEQVMDSTRSVASLKAECARLEYDKAC